MGTKNRQRRAAKAKQRAKDRSQRHHRDPRDRRPFTAAEQIHLATLGAVDARLRGDAERVQHFTDALARHRRHDVVEQAGGDLRRALPRLWEGGWQPAEIVRHARRIGARPGRLVAAAVLADHADRPATTLHPRWAAQVDSLADGDQPARVATPRSDWLTAFADREALIGLDLATTIVDALTACLGVGPLPVILPPPGSSRTGWPGGADRVHAADDDPVLAKVRALLAHAESTPFEEEAAAFTAKAQELMARHAIDIALVWEHAGRDERPVTSRLPVDEPYVDAKSLLLQIVAEHSRCRAVFHDRYAMSSVIGFASDVAATEVLFTSLLVQSQVAMQAEALAAGPGARVRSRSFRSSFLLAYAHRIDERLAAVNESVEAEADTERGGALLPVLAARSDAVDDAVEDIFGRLHAAPVRGGTDAIGWLRGQAAADRAQLSFADLEAAS